MADLHITPEADIVSSTDMEAHVPCGSGFTSTASTTASSTTASSMLATSAEAMPRSIRKSPLSGLAASYSETSLPFDRSHHLEETLEDPKSSQESPALDVHHPDISTSSASTLPSTESTAVSPLRQSRTISHDVVQQSPATSVAGTFVTAVTSLPRDLTSEDAKVMYAEEDEECGAPSLRITAVSSAKSLTAETTEQQLDDTLPEDDNIPTRQVMTTRSSNSLAALSKKLNSTASLHESAIPRFAAPTMSSQRRNQELAAQRAAQPVKPPPKRVSRAELHRALSAPVPRYATDTKSSSMRTQAIQSARALRDSSPKPKSKVKKVSSEELARVVQEPLPRYATDTKSSTRRAEETREQRSRREKENSPPVQVTAARPRPQATKPRSPNFRSRGPARRAVDDGHEPKPKSFVPTPRPAYLEQATARAAVAMRSERKSSALLVERKESAGKDVGTTKLQRRPSGPTQPAPFKLAGIERHEAHEAMRLARLEEQQQKERQQRAFQPTVLNKGILKQPTFVAQRGLVDPTEPVDLLPHAAERSARTRAFEERQRERIDEIKRLEEERLAAEEEEKAAEDKAFYEQNHFVARSVPASHYQPDMEPRVSNASLVRGHIVSPRSRPITSGSSTNQSNSDGEHRSQEENSGVYEEYEEEDVDQEALEDPRTPNNNVDGGAFPATDDVPEDGFPAVDGSENDGVDDQSGSIRESRASRLMSRVRKSLSPLLGPRE